MKNENSRKQSKKNRNLRMLAIILLLLSILLFLFISCEARNGANDDSLDKIVEMSDEELQAELNRRVEAGMINIQYQSSAVFDGDVSVSFNVKNATNNHGSLKFTILDESERTIYESQEIPPGYEINEIKLKKSLSKGTHNCRIIIGYAVDGAVSSSFPLSVEVR